MVAPRTSRCDPAAIDAGSEQSVSDTDSDGEVSLDLQGRKHVGQDTNTHGVYWLDVKENSSHTMFPMPGKDAADTLRQFLDDRLPAEHITDEYGVVKPIGEIKVDHLPSLQSKLWHMTTTSRTKTPPSSVALGIGVRRGPPLFNGDVATVLLAADNEDEQQRALLLANHAAFVAGLLEANHIFVVHDGSSPSCELRACHKGLAVNLPLSTIITVEPLIHWGTLTAELDTFAPGGKIQAFRRDGEESSDHLWTLAVKRFTPEHPTAYCVDCLELLMDNSGSAGVGIKQHAKPSFTAVNDQTAAGTRTHHTDKQIDSDMVKTGRKRTMSDSRHDAVNELRSSRYTVNENDNMASLYLDGAHDTPDSGDSEHSIRSNIVGIDHDRARSESSGIHCEITSSATSLGSNTSCENITGSAWPAINRKPLSVSLSSTHKVAFSPHTIHRTPLQRLPFAGKRTKPKVVTFAESIDQPGTGKRPPTSSRGTKRKFGQELDANTVVNIIKKATTAPRDMKLAKKDVTGTGDIRNFFSKSTENLEAKETVARNAKTQPIDVPTPEVEFDFSSGSSLTSLKPTTSEESRVSDKTYASEPKSRSSSRKSNTSKSSAAKPKDQSFAPVFAKRPPITITAIPDTLSDIAYRAYQLRVPSASEIICSCRKAARTPNVKIVQCSNTECVVGWYHYDCLDKSAKLSCRHGTLVCQHCKNETHFREQDEKNGWSVQKMVKAESAMPFSGRDMLGAMPAQGGGCGVVNPYWLGTAVEVPAVATRASRGALGELGFFGYVASAPLLVEKAHVHGVAHLNLSSPQETANEERYGAFQEEEEGYGDEEEEKGEALGEQEDWEDVDGEMEEAEDVVDGVNVDMDRGLTYTAPGRLREGHCISQMMARIAQQ